MNQVVNNTVKKEIFKNSQIKDNFPILRNQKYSEHHNFRGNPSSLDGFEASSCALRAKLIKLSDKAIIYSLNMEAAVHQTEEKAIITSNLTKCTMKYRETLCIASSVFTLLSFASKNFFSTFFLSTLHGSRASLRVVA